MNEQKKLHNGRLEKRKGLFLNRKGQSMVEFSFVIVVIMFTFALLAGAIQIAYSWIVLQYAASEASRFGSLGIVEAGYANREDNIRARTLQITQGFGVDPITVEFLDQGGIVIGTAGSPSEYFRMRIRHTLEMFGLARALTGQDNYQIVASTVIRNEPF